MKRLFVVLGCVILLAGVVTGVFMYVFDRAEPAEAEPIEWQEGVKLDRKYKFILDTDIGPDVDDAAALYIANLCVNRGDAELLCVTHCTSSPYGVGAIRAINNWCGHPDIPVGTLKTDGFLHSEEHEKYNKALANLLPVSDWLADDAVAVMRKALAEQEDGSVDIVAVGPLVNIAALLNSEPDDISPLSGRELIEQKVHALYLMAGCFDPEAPSPWVPDHAPMGKAPEWNVLMDVPAATDVVKKWPTPVVFGGAEIGNWVITLKDTSILPEDSPVRLAYDLYTQGAGRQSWDPLVVYFAMDPACNCIRLSEPGNVSIFEDGYMEFTPDADGNRYIMSLAYDADEVARILDNYMAEAN